MSESEDGNPAALKILEAELTRITAATHEAWRHFFTWFTWSLGTQTLALGWIMTNKDNVAQSPHVGMLTSAIVVFNVIGFLAARRIGSFVGLQSQRADLICSGMKERAEASGLNINITAGFSGDFIRSAAALCGAALATAGLVWVYLLSFNFFV
jgi:hypothetical protein